MSQFTGRFVFELDLTLDGDNRWIVREPFSFYSTHLASWVHIPRGFDTDFASVPKWLPLAYATLTTDEVKPAAVIHDWLYRVQWWSREDSDAVLVEAMEVLGVPSWKRHLIYLGIRVGGWKAWNDRVKEKNR